jgi:4-amino-4-deoxy-L-arabinose transferase-like glycosyltransferase
VASLGTSVALVKAANIMLFAASGVLLWDMTRRLFGKSAAYIALVTLVVYVPFYRFVPTILTEPLFVPLVMLALWLVIAFGDRGSTALLATGLALGAATLVRPTLQFYPLLLTVVGAVVLLVARRRGRPLPGVMRPILLVVAGFAVLVVPFAVKNAVVLDKVGIANGTGAVLYLGNDLRKHGYEPVDSRMRFDTIEVTSPYTHLDSEGDALLFAESMRRIGRDTLDVALLQPEKLIKLTVGSPEHYFRPQSDVVSFVQSRSGIDLLQIPELFLTAGIVVLGAVGLVILRIPIVPRIVLSSFVAYFLVVNTVLFPLPRLFLPAIPILIMFAAGAVTTGRRPLAIGAVVAALLIGLFISFEGAADGVATVSDRYRGYFDEVVAIDAELWDSSNDIVVPDGETIRSVGPDPFLVYDNDDFAASLNQLVFVTLQAMAPDGMPTTGTAQLFWRSPDRGFSEDHSERFEIIIDGRPHTYGISPSFRKPWERVIAHLRLDLPDNTPDLLFRIDELTVKK